MRIGLFTLMTACVFGMLMVPAKGQWTERPSPHAESAYEGEERGPAAIVSVGAATAWNTAGGAAMYAPAFAVETTPIEHWLEVEVGVVPFSTKAVTELDTDVLLKKPWSLSPKSEFMVGVGPQFVSVKEDGKLTKFVAGEVTADFMFWPAHGRRLGWYVQPAFDYSFAGDHAKTVGVSLGLLIGIR
jgi:hypothetical protein